MWDCDICVSESGTGPAKTCGEVSSKRSCDRRSYLIVIICGLAVMICLQKKFFGPHSLFLLLSIPSPSLPSTDNIHRPKVITPHQLNNNNSNWQPTIDKRSRNVRGFEEGDSLDDHLFQNFKLEFLKAYVFIMQILSNYQPFQPSNNLGQRGSRVNAKKRRKRN